MSQAPNQAENTSKNNIETSKFLLIDDEPLNISLLKKMLQKAGYHNIHTTTDPRQALTAYQDYTPDLVLLDYQMPHMDGLEVLNQLSAIDPNHSVPVLILTAETTKELRVRALQAGAKDFINKPFDRAEVINRIHNLLEIRQVYNHLKDQNLKLDKIVQERTAKLQQEQAALAALNSNLEKIVHERTLDLQEVNNKLEHVNNTMSELVSIVSHELRTPLTSIKSFAEILRDEDENLDIDSKKKFLNIINDESDRLSRLISDLLDLQKISSGKMVWKEAVVDLEKCAANTVEFFTPAYNDKGFTITFESDIDNALVNTDADKIRQVLSNLLSNALKFTEKGGTSVTLSTNCNWATILLISNDKDAAHALTIAAEEINARIILINGPEDATDYLNNHVHALDLIIADISNGESTNANFIDYLHEQYSALPITTLYESEYTNGGSTVDYASKAIRKPIALEKDKAALQLVLADLIGINPTTLMIQIAIKDTGVGIPENQLSKVFAQFHQVDTSQIREQRGTGLGLSICHEIIKHYGGKIWAESIEGEGSTFYLLLPQLKEQKKKLGEILIEKGLVTEEQLSNALKDQ